MSPVCFRDVQKSYRSLQGAEYVAVEHFRLPQSPYVGRRTLKWLKVKQAKYRESERG